MSSAKSIPASSSRSGQETVFIRLQRLERRLSCCAATCLKRSASQSNRARLACVGPGVPLRKARMVNSPARQDAHPRRVRHVRSHTASVARFDNVVGGVRVRLAKKVTTTSSMPRGPDVGPSSGHHRPPPVLPDRLERSSRFQFTTERSMARDSRASARQPNHPSPAPAVGIATIGIVQVHKTF